ncbi:hypothetical protein SAMN05192551_10953 [Tindallia magadiensis]|uniref:DNA alkylation repair enzyme n=1 Tax=Tindallia magadiensis TaxID=69895 RepID=A0A1I3GI78_9FIRM|nr:hypothetical protein [Tindallia magadiensis]SFI23200.1 hypothetical protein SAMN05192551_10953 [Tindallia magadiensis]
MNKKDVIDHIIDERTNRDTMVKQIIEHESCREEVIYQLLNNKEIQVYYTCYEIVTKASEERPDLFYPYWDELASLLNHSNSYHRNIGLTMIANMTKIDEKDLFATIYDRYMEHFNDPKFMTAQCFLQNLKKIIRFKKQDRERIVKALINIDQACDYPEKQKELLKSDVIEVLKEAYEVSEDEEKQTIASFIAAQVNSSSPKTAKTAKDYLKKRKRW